MGRPTLKSDLPGGTPAPPLPQKYPKDYLRSAKHNVQLAKGRAASFLLGVADRLWIKPCDGRLVEKDFGAVCPNLHLKRLPKAYR